MVRTIHDGIIEDLRTLRESIDKYAHMGVEKNVKDLKSFAEAILVKLNPDEKSDLNFIESLVYMIRHYDGAKLIGNVKASLDAYLATEDQLKELEKERDKMNHAAFYDRMKRIAEIMAKKQKKEGNTAVAEYLRDIRYSGEWTNTDIEDENDKKFLKDFLFTITYYSDPDDIVNHCSKRLNYYLDDNKETKKELTKTSHEEMIELAKRIRGALVMLDSDTNEDFIATNAFSIINNLKSKLPVADNNDDRFIKQMVDIAHNYSGQEMVYNMIATIDKWHMFKVEDPNLLSIDEFSKKISNKKKMDKDNVGYTILCEMKNLVEQTTTKLATNIEEEDYSNSLDKRLINRDLQSLLNSYSNILEVLGQYYVKLEK